MHRVQQVVAQTCAATAATAEEESSWERSQERSRHFQNLKWNGWGYRDTAFELLEDGVVALTGERYAYSGKRMPQFRPWMEKNVGIRMEDTSPAQEKMEVEPARVNKAFVERMRRECPGMRIGTGDLERVDHAHGHSMQEIYELRFGKLERVPDLVVYPESHLQVEKVVKAAVECDVVLIPFGGGTSVTHALMCPKEEQRCIVSVDMHEMNHIKWINLENMEACIEAGAVGIDIEKMLAKEGLYFGHEPDSYEFSTLGGWIATRASGMKKNRYGNIEDLVIEFKIVTPKGTIIKSSRGPRVSLGPDIYEFFLGSEGTLGIITEAVVKITRMPECRAYGSIVFKNFESGLNFMKEVGLRRIAPASIRLVDNLQFVFGQTLKPLEESWVEQTKDAFKKIFLTKMLNFDLEEMVVCTLLFEGSRAEVTSQQKEIYAAAKRHGGLSAGEENGRRGYFLTYVIAYIRDIGLDFQSLAESFETSIPYKDVLPLCNRVRSRIIQVAKEKGFIHEAFSSCRVTQLYDTGACVYFYIGVKWTGPKDPMRAFSELEEAAREEVLACGGSLSHHHGVGKIRKKWLPNSISAPGVDMLRALKQHLDPSNIFASGNLF